MERGLDGVGGREKGDLELSCLRHHSEKKIKLNSSSKLLDRIFSLEMKRTKNGQVRERVEFRRNNKWETHYASTTFR